jgi:antitoxin VapB
VALNIKNDEAERLARKVAAATGETLTGAIVGALRERLERLEQAKKVSSLADQLETIARRTAALPLLDPRSLEDIIGYNEDGRPR